MVCEILSKFKHKKVQDTRKIYFEMSDNVVFQIVFLMGSAICLLYGRFAVMGQAKPEFKAIDNPAAFSGSILTKVGILLCFNEILNNY